MAKLANASKKGAKVEEVQEVEEVQFTPTGIMISRSKFQNDYAVVSGENFVKLQVASVSPRLPVIDRNGDEVFSNSDGRQLEKHIINLKAIPAQHLKAVKALWEGRDEIDLGELRGKTLSVNALIPDSDEIELPYKGQRISVETGYVTNSQDELVLVGLNYQLPKATAATKFSFGSEEEEEIEIED